jgi:hypothetical protein
MNRDFYIDKGFGLYAIMIASDKYTQGIEIMYPSKPIKSDNQPAVYILTNREGKLLKIGETQNLTSRFHQGYRCISNSTNNKIRDHVKDVENVWVYILPMRIEFQKVLGFKCETSYAKGLEQNLLVDYKKQIGILPELNAIKK